MSPPAPPVAEVAAAFGLPAAGARWAPLGSGRIHHTYVAEYPGLPSPSRRVHQCLNRRVFVDPQGVMDNVARISRHLHAGLGDLPEAQRRRRVLTLLTTVDGRPCFIDARGDWWRTFHYVEDAVSHDHAPGTPWIRAAARAYARFSDALADLPPPPLAEVLPGFHDTPARLVALEQALGRAAGERVREAAALGAALLERRDLAGLIPRALAAGTLPTRICHNDTKLNNVLFAADGAEALAVVDLDTVMPGSVLHDFGDLVRSTIAVDGEEGDPRGPVTLRLDRFTAALEGYLGAARPWLTGTELELMAFAPAAITLELAARFLSDYLAGDRYFPVTRPGDNLRRAVRQYRLLAAMEGRHEAMARAVAGVAAGLE